MLALLKIENFALIDKLELNLNSGFTVVTGETGAGKSIILNALQLVLGARADLNLIQNSEKKCIIEASFKISEDKRVLFENADLDFWELSVLRREITVQGKSRMFVNDSPVNLATLKLIGQEMLQIHSQHQTYELKSKEFSLNLLDDLGILGADKQVYSKEFQEYRSIKSELELCKEAFVQNVKELDFLTFQFNEFDGMNFKDDFESLQVEFDQIENASVILQSLNGCNEVLSEGDEAVIGHLKKASDYLNEVEKYAPELNPLIERINASRIELEDINSEIEMIAGNVGMDPDQKIMLEEKLNLYNSLSRKHFTNSQEELVNVKNGLSDKIDSISNVEGNIQELELSLNKQLTKVKGLAKELSAKRKAVAKEVVPVLVNELNDLSMKESTIVFSFESKDPSMNGVDDIACLISTNKGMNPGPIEKTISGGEMSRFMLSIQNLLSEKKALPTMIFDEIDTGVSGLVAEQMANKMNDMSKRIQILSISHLPQVAAKGSSHLKVSKLTSGGKTTSTIVELNHEERVNELAILLSGSEVTNEALSHAKGLLTK
jgi:DNA repair protein RecN (Recombination protein N)